MSRKSVLKLFIVRCIFASILDFAQFVQLVLVSDHSFLPTPLTRVGKSRDFKKIKSDFFYLSQIFSLHMIS